MAYSILAQAVHVPSVISLLKFAKNVQSRAKRLSENLGGAESDKGAGEFEHGQVVSDFLFPADQQPTKAIHPRMCAFHDPAPSPIAGDMLFGLRFFAPRTNVRYVTELGQDLAYLIKIVAFVQAQILRGLLRGLRARALIRVSNVVRTIFMSLRSCLPQPRPGVRRARSVSRLRFVPDFPRSVGLGPVPAPPRGALVIAAHPLSRHSQTIPWALS